MFFFVFIICLFLIYFRNCLFQLSLLIYKVPLLVYTNTSFSHINQDPMFWIVWETRETKQISAKSIVTNQLANEKKKKETLAFSKISFKSSNIVTITPVNSAPEYNKQLIAATGNCYIRSTFADSFKSWWSSAGSIVNNYRIGLTQRGFWNKNEI